MIFVREEVIQVCSSTMARYIQSGKLTAIGFSFLKLELVLWMLVDFYKTRAGRDSFLWFRWDFSIDSLSFHRYTNGTVALQLFQISEV